MSKIIAERGQEYWGSGNVWKDFVGSELPVLPISEPPCKWCNYFKPQVLYRHTVNGFEYDGLRLCHADEMNADFSCFEKKDE